MVGFELSVTVPELVVFPISTPGVEIPVAVSVMLPLAITSPNKVRSPEWVSTTLPPLMVVTGPNFNPLVIAVTVEAPLPPVTA